MQAGDAELAVEGRRVVVHGIEVVVKVRLADEVVDEADHLGRTLREKVIVDDDQALGVLAPTGLTQGLGSGGRAPPRVYRPSPAPPAR